jgi:hypothetical protein
MVKHLDLLEAIETSDSAKASKLFEDMTDRGIDPWSIHDSIFPVVQFVTNPPFINPHLPKMYRTDRELASFLDKKHLPALVQLEINECARRPKMKPLHKLLSKDVGASFRDAQKAIQDRDAALTAAILSKMYSSNREDLVRQMLILGSGYVNESLGHSTSCTGFILLEILDKRDIDPWPALATLADYFCKGGYDKIPTPRTHKEVAPDRSADGTNSSDLAMLRAVSGRGLVNLHHTILRYAIERTRHLLSPSEYTHFIDSWMSFMGEKEAEPFLPRSGSSRKFKDYEEFHKMFSGLDAEPVVANLSPLLDTPSNRMKVGKYLVRGICDLYQGNYNPHYLTGLASVLWVIGQQWGNKSIPTTALYQFLSYYFENLV